MFWTSLSGRMRIKRLNQKYCFDPSDYTLTRARAVWVLLQAYFLPSDLLPARFPYSKGCSMALVTWFGVLVSLFALPEVIPHPCDGQYGPYIEGAAVGKGGQLFAVNWGAKEQRNTVGLVNEDCALTATVDDMPGSQLNGLRVLPSGAMLATDIGNHRVVLIEGQESSTFCNGTMNQPNDLAVSRKGDVYLSGQLWTDNTTLGDGDIWLCRKGAPAKKLAGNLGRTNGIELSLDEKYLFVSEAFNLKGRPVSNKIWKYALRTDGTLGAQTLFYDFAMDGKGSVDIDGMRMDILGNLYVARNEGQAVVVIAPSGIIIKTYPLPFWAPTNIELGGPNGKTLVVVGRCGVGTVFGEGMGCVTTFQVDAPGRAWAQLHSNCPEPELGVASSYADASASASASAGATAIASVQVFSGK